MTPGEPATKRRARPRFSDEPVRLEAVIERLGRPEIIGDPGGVLVDDVQYDDRRVQPRSPDEPGGDLFCCVPGSSSDGHGFAAAARRRGAVAFLCERPLGAAAGGAPQLLVGPREVRPAMAAAACVVHHDPATQLQVAGITGTAGKTTTTYLLASIWEAAGLSTAVIGTLTGARTTPEAPDLQRQLSAAATAGRAAVAMEVTSHALVQHRVDGYRHDVAVFTNLSQDHLDFHLTMEKYFEAKASLFTPEHAYVGVVNADDAYGSRLLQAASIPLRPFRLRDATALEVGLKECTFVLDGEPVRLRLLGELNVRNAIAAAAAARELGVDAATVAEGLSSATGPPGRLESVENALGINVVVDYSHKPGALREVLAALRRLTGDGLLIVVFGAGGDRDRTKRPLMGAAASALADLSVITSDNPRHEDPLEIIEDVKQGAEGGSELIVEPDRRRAIAIALARAAEVAPTTALVLVAGKGHERTQQIGDELIDFDDREVVVSEAANLAARR